MERTSGVSWCKLINGKKLLVTVNKITCRAGSRIVLRLRRIFANGQRVEGGCVTRRSHPATDPGTLAGICPGGKTGMAQFLQIPVRNW